EMNGIVREVRPVKVDVVLFSQTAKARDVEHAGHRLELLLADPVLDFFLLDQVMIRALYSVAVDLTDRILRRKTRLDALRQRDEAQLVYGLDAVELVIAAPLVIVAVVGR